MKKILITGASGNIGFLARIAYRDHQLTLWSRTPISLNNNEVWQKSEPLQNLYWWENLDLTNRFDVILHLAEPVKKRIREDECLKIVNSHTSFLKKASDSANTVLYPDTAYNYDRHLSKINFQYKLIKNLTRKEIIHKKNIYMPIIHPLIDYGTGLLATTKIIEKIPFFNILCEIDSTLPILKKTDLSNYLHLFLDGKIMPDDWYSYEDSISKIFYCPNKSDNIYISKLLIKTMMLFDYLPLISLILNGRKLR